MSTQPIFKPGRSRTKAGQAMSVAKIQDHFVKGKPIPQARAPIHEPKLENLRNPMRRPYCDLVDVAKYHDDLKVALNNSEQLLSDKKKEFLKEHKKVNDSVRENFAQYVRDSLKNE